jgi:hypothetical protein
MGDRAKFTVQERNKAIEEVFKKALEKINKPPYTKEGFANGNFWDWAEKYNVTPEQALAVKMGEHVNIIEDFIKHPDKKLIDLTIAERILENIDSLAVLYTILVEKGTIDHRPLQKITIAKAPQERCGDCGATPDSEGKIYHKPECKA